MDPIFGEQFGAYFSDQFREARLLLASDGSADLVLKLEDVSSRFASMHTQLNCILILMTNLQKECFDKASEIQDEIELAKKADTGLPFVFHGKHSGLSWGDMSDIEDRRNLVIQQSTQLETALTDAPELKADSAPLRSNARAHGKRRENTCKEITSIDGVSLPKKFALKEVSSLDDLQSAIAWYVGDKTHRSGIYIRLLENMFVRIPFPDVIDGAHNFARTKTIKCKYETEDKCLENRRFLANKFKTELRECLFAHHGEPYTKVGTNFRCPALPRIGNHANLKSDIDAIKANDIKPLLMYALSDLLTCVIWHDFHHSDDKIIFSDVEICQ